ncbi:hypothetical protein ASPSYDRAFT_1018177 [Aspergillus sydowii CBS 593.65]|uniref:Uncharacterized protein n=1 Tax=Aspergillus sydowii CBS 593.65 TaxID=1036612 RepID=A0A1L9TER2_9EURO|nr:uncharacterized protein ASPSYDRAFT_1018177 [Aspergillus sydowii CBS 593.65]OJJ57920.1 hypothetical protein ASPSYDRAFT_1018177 [Aspergillus sydowii CBS 593.65]
MESDDSSRINVDNNVAATPAREAEVDPGFICLADTKTNSLMALHLERVDDLPEYPVSHEHGHVYAVEAGGRSREELVRMIHNVQYAWSQPYGQNGRQVFSPYLACYARKWTWKCSGIYCCEFLDQKIRSHHHTAVDESIWQEIEKHQGPAKLIESDMRKRDAYSYYRSKVTLFKINRACIDQLPDCKPVFRRSAHMPAPYIGCSNDTDDCLSKHHRPAGPVPATLDIEFLEELFNKGLLPPAEVCGTIEPVSSRKKYCGRDHPQGRGKLIHTPCEVIFNALVPVDLEGCPYVAFSSHGVHRHPPPLPSQTPKRIPKGISDVEVQKRDRGLTTKEFLESPGLADFCRKHNASSLAEIHPSFADNRLVTRLIRKVRLESEQSREDFNGLARLTETDKELSEYIKECYMDKGDFMVFCAYNDQIRLLSQTISFDIDDSVKRVRSKVMHEISFTTFLPQQNKLITFLRVFTSFNSTESYCLLFKRAFGLVEKVSLFPVQFKHINGLGLADIMVDSGTAHAGLGQYLSEIDPEHRASSWHLENACTRKTRAEIATLRQPTDTGEQVPRIMQSFASGRPGAREKYSTLAQMVQPPAKADRDDITQYKDFLHASIHRPYRNPALGAIHYYLQLEHGQGEYCIVWRIKPRYR